MTIPTAKLRVEKLLDKGKLAFVVLDVFARHCNAPVTVCVGLTINKAGVPQ